MNKLEILARDLPDPEAALRFFEQFSHADKRTADRALKNEGVLSDLLALASYSPLLAATLIQNPGYSTWLAKERADISVRSKEELLESLSRFAMTHSQVEPHVLFARFRRRELLRIFLKDIRRLGSVAEITEEISNLADAILENALRIARQEADNRFGPPFEVDEKGRQRPSDICIVSLGKLGSKELNYSSDIDLLFIYTTDGSTNGAGTKEAVTNREYFTKVAEYVIALIGKQTGEGAAYRVDMRLRPHGRVGSLVLSLRDTCRYYLSEARGWEQQVLIRSRASAGNANLFKEFASNVEEVVFRPGRDIEEALQEVFLSKQRIDLSRRDRASIDVKLDPGGIREIEFIAQALQLAYGGTDRWLRVPHTLISISRLSDRGLLSESERSGLSNAYAFLRRLEHLLQMEHGLQTHSISADPRKLEIMAKRLNCPDAAAFISELKHHMGIVHAAFERLFQRPTTADGRRPADRPGGLEKLDTRPSSTPSSALKNSVPTNASVAFIGTDITDSTRQERLSKATRLAPRFAHFLASRPWLQDDARFDGLQPEEYAAAFSTALEGTPSRADVLRELRRTWSGIFGSIYLRDIFGEIGQGDARRLLTALAEASIGAAISLAAGELGSGAPGSAFEPIVAALGKLGSGTVDYDSDLDVVIAYDGGAHRMPVTDLYSRGVASLLDLLSSITRDGNLYRIDLRLRPHGKSGPLAMSVDKICEYLRNNAAVWEMLAYAQLRVPSSAAGDAEPRLRKALRERAASMDSLAIRREAVAIRSKLEAEHGGRSDGAHNIKFGPGGLMDIYFATRYLSLTDDGEITAEAHSTAARLEAFERHRLMPPEIAQPLREGHAFLSTLDHNIRLLVGKTSRFPRSDRPLADQVASRMGLPGGAELESQFNLHRLNVRAAYEELMIKY